MTRINTFLDPNELWEKHNMQDICNQRTWKKNFNLAHSFYNQNKKTIKDGSTKRSA